MSRFCGEHNAAPILDAAARWRDAALLQDGSVFTNRALWTVGGLNSLVENFIQQPDPGEGKFWEKLKGQLSRTEPEVKQLMAEMSWVMLLCPSNILAKRKREQVGMVWGWSGQAIPDSAHAYLTEQVLRGIGSAGPGFNNHRWREVEFCINTCLQFKGLAQAQRKSTLSDPWMFAEWLATVPDSDARQLRHMLVFLLFPDTFERIFGQTDRRAVLVSLAGKTPSAAAHMDPVAIDKELLGIRRKLEKELGTSEVDFYLSPVEERWNSEEAKVEVIAETQKETSKDQQLAELISKFVKQAREGTNLVTRDYVASYLDLEVRVSFGQGVFARVPWVAFVAHGQTVQRGIYPVLLLYREQDLLLLCYGVSETNPPSLPWPQRDEASTVQGLFSRRFHREPPRYGESYVMAEYDLGQPLPAEEIAAKIHKLITEYKDVLKGQRLEMPAPARQDIGQVASSFSDALRSSSVSFGAQHDDLVRSFIASVATKPFVILTGLSGSGKTQIAIRFGDWLGDEDRVHLVPVRPDWTGAESLLGFEDGLKPASKGFAAWHVPDVLKFILRAAEDPGQPYLLILDEMNLAHVERYFADVLSGMESGHRCVPNLGRDELGTWRMKSLHDTRIPFPKNLWIVGTVNVDETTYMFSPKVLDRANTFEFRVNADDLQQEYLKPTPCASGDPALVRGLLEITRNNSWQLTHAPSYIDEFQFRLRQLHHVLSQYNLEFGHRVFFESLRFAALAEAAGLEGLERALDRVVMQKALPRLHGSRRRLENPLLSLAHFCRDLPTEVAVQDKVASAKADVLGGAAAKLPVSYDKIGRMLRSLRANQFVSFTE